MHFFGDTQMRWCTLSCQKKNIWWWDQYIYFLKRILDQLTLKETVAFQWSWNTGLDYHLPIFSPNFAIIATSWFWGCLWNWPIGLLDFVYIGCFYPMEAFSIEFLRMHHQFSLRDVAVLLFQGRTMCKSVFVWTQINIIPCVIPRKWLSVFTVGFY